MYGVVCIGEQVNSPGLVLVLSDDEGGGAVGSATMAWVSPCRPGYQTSAHKGTVNNGGYRPSSNGAANSIVSLVLRVQLIGILSTAVAVPTHTCSRVLLYCLGDLIEASSTSHPYCIAGGA